jgi:hypothetical protein
MVHKKGIVVWVVRRLTNGIRIAAKAARGSGWLGHCVPTPASTHTFAVAGMLRIPLSQPQKRQLPRTLCNIGAKLIKKILWGILCNLDYCDMFYNIKDQMKLEVAL